MQSGLIMPASSFMTATRASNATGIGSNGVVYSFANNIPVITDNGLLSQPAATNLFLRAQEFENVAWTSSNITHTPNSAVAPDGTTTADLLTLTNTSHSIWQTITTTASTTYTVSWWVKRGTATDLKYSIRDLTGAADIVASTSYYSDVSATGWTRVTKTFTTPVGCVSVRVFLLRDSGVTGTVCFWGSQAELGSVPTSYIVTTTATVTRSADTLQVNNFGTWYNTIEGTIVSEVMILDGLVSSEIPILCFEDATKNEMIRISKDASNKLRAFIRNAGATSANFTSVASVAANTPFKFAVSYKANDFKFQYLSESLQTDVAGAVPANDRLYIGSGGFLTSSPVWVRKLYYIPTSSTGTQLTNYLAAI